MAQADLPPTLPLFPLSGALLLPRGWLPLLIFEPRYVAMLDAVLAARGRLVGMIQPDGAGFAEVGCAGRVTSVHEIEEGLYSITLTGISRFRLAAPPDASRPFLTASVDWRGFQVDLQPVEAKGFDRDKFRILFKNYSAVRGQALDNAACEKMGVLGDEDLINHAAMWAGFSDRDEQALLEAPTLGERGAILISLMQFALCGGTGEDKVQ